jgi:predicted flap endonuclease-1-like 5' DNA nuclease
MQAILTSGHTIECGNFKAIDSGVVLTEDAKRKRVVGFVPNERLAYVVPDELADELIDAVESESAPAGGGTETDDRLEAIEARLDELAGGVDEVSSVETGVSITVEEDETEAGDETGTQVDVVYESDAAVESDEATTGTAAEATEQAVTEAVEEPEPAEPIAAEDDDSAAETAAAEPESEIESEPEPEGEPATDESEGEIESEPEPEGEPAAAEPESEPEGETAAAEPESEKPELTSLRGLGPTYAERLAADGIETIADLRAASVEELAAAADVGESRAEDWKRQAAE